MIVVMKTKSNQEHVDEVNRHLTVRGLSSSLSKGVERTVVGVDGQIYPELQNELEMFKLACQQS